MSKPSTLQMEWLSREGLIQYGLAFATFFCHASSPTALLEAGLGTSLLMKSFKSIIFKHRLHPILLGYVIRATLKGILQSQPIERHFNEYSTITPRNFCSKFELSTSTKLNTYSQLQSPVINTTLIPCRNLLILMYYWIPLI